jgi:acyl carrier protein
VDEVDMTVVPLEQRTHIPSEEREMTAMDMKKRIVEIIATQLGIDQADITPQANVVDDLGADSLDVVELIMALEEEFNLEIPDEEAEKIKNVQDIFTYLESALKAA